MAQNFATKQLRLSGKFLTTDSAAELYIDGDRLLKSNETGIFSTTGHDHDAQYYSIANPNGYASSGDLSGVSGALQSKIDNLNTWTGDSTGIYVSRAETGLFYPSNNPSGYITGVNTGHNHDAQYYPLLSNPSGYVTTGQTGVFYLASNPSGFITGFQDAVEFSTKSGAYNLPFLTGQFVFDTGNGYLYLVANDGNRYLQPFKFLTISGDGADIGPSWLETNRLGYGLGYVTDKTLSNIKIGDSAISGEGALRFHDGVLQLYANGTWNDNVIGFRFREDSTGNYELEHKPIGFDTWLNVREGTSNETGPDGLPIVRGYHVNMGPYGVDLVIDGGDGR
jgi:hypothetical protein